jgi:hypothetical protein
VSAQVTMPDGTETDLAEHLSLVHKKGTRGLTEDYLAAMHETLHERKRDPFPEHDHLVPPPADSVLPADPAPAGPAARIPSPRRPAEP